MAKRKKVSFLANKKVRKQIYVEFERSDGTIARFKASKIVNKPVKVTFYKRKKKKYY